jgi:serine/threonine protein kinase/uncharacterized membrane protein
MASEIFCDTCGAANQPGQRFCFACGKALTAANVSQQAPSTPPTGLLAPSTLLKQRYHILRAIGAGGMGAVYSAEDTELGDRLVAIKEMSQQKLSAQGITDAADNFKREAHLLARLQNPNLPSIHDYFTEGGRWYLVMEFIPGETLQKYLAQHGGKLSVAEAVQIGLVLCSVLDYLHSQQPPIIFRDLKPANIMRTPDGEIYLIDFGIARHFKPGQAKDTSAFGSAGYAAPEQYGRSQTTPRSDIYSLGGVLYQMLSGRSPSLTPFNLPALQTLNANLPAALVDLVTDMTSLDEKQRPTSMRIVKQELMQIASPVVPVSTVPSAATLPAQQKKIVLPAPPVLAPRAQIALPKSLSFPSPGQIRQQIDDRIVQIRKRLQGTAKTVPASPAMQQLIPRQVAASRANQLRMPPFIAKKPSVKAIPGRNPAPAFDRFWSRHKQMLLTVLFGTLLSMLIMFWLDRGSFPTWYQFVVGTVPFRISLFFVLDMLTLLLALYFGVSWGPWAGLCVGGLGTLLGDYLSYNSGHFAWNWDLRIALAGLLVGLLLRRAMGYTRISHTYIYGCCTLAIIVGTAFASYSDLWLRHETFSVASYIFIAYSALSLVCCLLLYLLARIVLGVRRRVQMTP